MEERRIRSRSKDWDCKLNLCRPLGLVCERCGRVVFREDDPPPISGETIHGDIGKGDS